MCQAALLVRAIKSGCVSLRDTLLDRTAEHRELGMCGVTLAHVVCDLVTSSTATAFATRSRTIV